MYAVMFDIFPMLAALLTPRKQHKINLNNPSSPVVMVKISNKAPGLLLSNGLFAFKNKDLQLAENLITQYLNIVQNNYKVL